MLSEAKANQLAEVMQIMIEMVELAKAEDPDNADGWEKVKSYQVKQVELVIKIQSNPAHFLKDRMQS